MPAAVAPLGAEIDDPVGGLDDFEVVLDDEDRVAGLDEGVQHFEELFDVLEMEPRRRLIQYVERSPGGAARQFLRQLDALRLAARQRRRRLADMGVPEPD